MATKPRLKLLQVALSEASLDPRDVISATLKHMGIESHRYETGGKHMHAVYTLNGREHRFPFSHGKRWDGPIRQQIASAVKRHVRAAMSQK